MPAPGSGRLLAWIVALAAAEVMIARGEVLAGQIADAVLLVLLVNAGQRSAERELGEGPRRRIAATRALALVALVRVVGPGLPLRDLSAVVGEALVAIVIALAAFRAAPTVGVSRRMLYRTPNARAQLGTALGGLALGLGAYRLGAPALVSQDDAVGRICPAAAAAAATGLVEEVVFRGLVQVSLQRLAGGAGALAAAGLFACTYLSVGSTSLVLLVAVAGLLFAHSVARTGALSGASVGHMLFACGAVVCWPLLLGPAPGASPEPATALALAAVALVGAVLLARGSVVPVDGPRAVDDVGEPGTAPGPPAHAPT